LLFFLDLFWRGLGLAFGEILYEWDLLLFLADGLLVFNARLVASLKLRVNFQVLLPFLVDILTEELDRLDRREMEL